MGQGDRAISGGVDQGAQGGDGLGFVAGGEVLGGNGFGSSGFAVERLLQICESGAYETG
jgi:hypothetical protein